MNISEEWSHLNNLDDDRLYEMAMELRPDIHSIEVLGEKICEHIIKYRLYEFDRLLKPPTFALLLTVLPVHK